MTEEKDDRNEDGTCDGCGLGEHPSDPCCDWHWNTPPIVGETPEGNVLNAPEIT